MVTKAALLVAVGLAGAIGLDVMYAWWIDRERIPRVVRALQHGSADVKVIEDEPYFERPAEEAQVKPLVKASRGGFYNLVTGEHGTGTPLLRSMPSYCP